MKSNGERHPEEILAHMEHTRAEMDDTLHAIERDWVDAGFPTGEKFAALVAEATRPYA